MGTNETPEPPAWARLGHPEMAEDLARQVWESMRSPEAYRDGERAYLDLLSLAPDAAACAELISWMDRLLQWATEASAHQFPFEEP